MDVELMAQLREGTGKGAARRLRGTGRVPASLYGPKMEPVSLSVSSKELEMLLRGIGEESKLLRLTVGEGGDQFIKQVLIREVQVHPVRRRFLHVDFYEVPLDQPIVVDVPIELKGESVGVKKGGTINVIRRMVSVRCLPGEIPERIPVDVTGLDLGGTIHIGDLAGGERCELVEDENITIINMEAPEGAGGGEGAGE